MTKLSLTVTLIVNNTLYSVVSSYQRYGRGTPCEWGVNKHDTGVTLRNMILTWRFENINSVSFYFKNSHVL